MALPKKFKSDLLDRVESFKGETLEKSSRIRIFILEKAIDLITIQGFSNLTLANVSRATEMAKQSILYHYKNMTELNIDLYRFYTGLAQQMTLLSLVDKNCPEEKILGMIEGTCRWIFFYPPFAKIHLISYHYAALDENLFSFHQNILEKGEERVVQFLNQIDGIGSKEAVKIGSAIHNMMIGTLFKVASLNDEDNLKKHGLNLVYGLEKLIGYKYPRRLLKFLDSRK